MAHDEGGEPGLKRIRNMSELARLAGVSAGTVSRALAGKALVNAETRERIQQLARDHGFRPNQMASKLRTRRTNVIGIVIPLGHERRQHISDPFFMTLMGHLFDGLTQRGYDMMLSRVLPDDPDWLDRLVDSGMLEGVLMIGQSDQIDVIDRVARRYRPMVVWGERIDGQVHCSVGTDNATGGRLAARRLIDGGRRRLAFLGDIRPPEIAARFAGAATAVAAAGLPAIEPLATHFTPDEAEADLGRHFGRILGTVDGVICASDLIASTALRVLADRGVGVPDDMAVIGFDGLPMTAQTVPRLTTIAQDIEGGAKLMIDALFARLGGDDTPSMVMSPRLMARDSA